jgi:hypothetical protein
VGSTPAGRNASENGILLGEIGFCNALFEFTHVYRFLPKIRHFDLKNGNKWQQ